MSESEGQPHKKLTIPDLAARKAAGERLAMVAVGEVLSAAWAERAGIDIIGVGDSLGLRIFLHELGDQRFFGQQVGERVMFEIQPEQVACQEIRQGRDAVGRHRGLA